VILKHASMSLVKMGSAFDVLAAVNGPIKITALWDVSV
jgi:hypothetical protein